MKKSLIFIIIIVASFLSSCSTDNNNNNEPNTTNHLVKREYISNTVNLEYMYNENDHLTQIIDINIPEDIDSETTFSYESNNVVTKNFVSNSSNYNSIDNYSYDGNNRLENVVSTINNGINTVNITQAFSYSNNIITIDINSSTGAMSEIILVVNSLGLINEMIKDEYYTIITYFSNGNIAEIESYDNDDNLLDSTVYLYDNKPNPFHGKLESIYLPVFLNAFIDADFGEFVWHGYEGYYFPFLKNNITSIIRNGNIDRDYNYLYDDQNYPIHVNEVFNGMDAYEFDIEYD